MNPTSMKAGLWIAAGIAALASGPAMAQDISACLITKTDTNPFFVKMREGAAAKAEELGIALSSYAGKVDGDNESQVAAVETCVANGASGILITASDTAAITPVLQTARRRTMWLGINLATAFLASWVIGLFEATIAQVVALAVLMPSGASMGGIAGTQTLTIVIRGMALGQRVAAGLAVAADFHCMRAAGGEDAAPGLDVQVRDIARDHRQDLHARGLAGRVAFQQRLGIGMRGAIEDVAHVAVLDHLAGIHDHHLVT